jgi:hypothetical protein
MLTKHYPLSVIVANRQLHDECINVVTRNALLKVYLQPFTESISEDWSVLPRQTRRRNSSPNCEIIRLIQQCTVKVQFTDYIKQIRCNSDKAKELGWSKVLDWLLNFQVETAKNLQEIYLELHLWQTCDWLNNVWVSPSAKPFKALGDLEVTKIL